VHYIAAGDVAAVVAEEVVALINEDQWPLNYFEELFAPSVPVPVAVLARQLL